MCPRTTSSSCFLLENIKFRCDEHVDEMNVGGLPAILLVEFIFKLFDGPPQFLLLCSGLP